MPRALPLSSNSVFVSFNENYTCECLNQLTNFSRGTHSQTWAYDALGNWSSFVNDSTVQTRTANRQNQIGSISGLTTPTYDANGNLTTDETGRQLVYDAWNRLVTVKNSVGAVLATFKYDALDRRIQTTESG